MRPGVMAGRPNEAQRGLVFAASDTPDRVANGSRRQPGDLIRLLADDGVGFDSPTAGSRIVLDLFDISRVVDPRDLGRRCRLPTVLPTASAKAAFIEQL